jgi:hypothetical protein
MIVSAVAGTILSHLYLEFFYQKLSENFKFGQNRTKIIDTTREDLLYIYDDISPITKYKKYKPCCAS